MELELVVQGIRNGSGVEVIAEQTGMGLGSGSGRELELGTRPSAHLLVAHQVDLDVR